MRRCVTVALLTDGSLSWGHATRWAQLVPPRLQHQPVTHLRCSPITHQLLEIRWRLP